MMCHDLFLTGCVKEWNGGGAVAEGAGLTGTGAME